MKKTLFFILAALISIPVYAEKTPDEYIADLKSDNSALTVEALKALGQKKEEKAISEIIPLLEKKDSPTVQFQAAIALGEIGKAGSSTAALIKLARESVRSEIQYASLVSLAAIKDADKKSEVQELLSWISANTKDDLLKDLASKLSGVLK